MIKKALKEQVKNKERLIKVSLKDKVKELTQQFFSSQVTLSQKSGRLKSPKSSIELVTPRLLFQLELSLMDQEVIPELAVPVPVVAVEDDPPFKSEFS